MLDLDETGLQAEELPPDVFAAVSRFRFTLGGFRSRACRAEAGLGGAIGDVNNLQ